MGGVSKIILMEYCIKRKGIFLFWFVFSIILITGVSAENPSQNTSREQERADRLDGKFQTRLVWSDGKHNAFTGAASWKENVIIVFRHAEHHVSFDGQIKIIATKDGKDFSEWATISIPGKDLRDPKIINTGNELKIYAGAVDEKDIKRWHTEPRLFTSENGKDWKQIPMKGLPADCWLWFTEYTGDIYYGSVYHRVAPNRPSQATLYKSKDGIHWEPFFTVTEKHSNEVALDTDNEGRLYALIRQEKPPYHPLYIKIADPEGKPGLCEVAWLDFPLQGPFLKRMKDGCLIIGRRWEDSEKDTFFTNPSPNRRVEMIWLGDEGDIERLCTLKSGGDCSYAGWATLPKGDTLVSYYSGHETNYPQSNIYVAIFPPGVLPPEE